MGCLSPDSVTVIHAVLTIKKEFFSPIYVSPGAGLPMLKQERVLTYLNTIVRILIPLLPVIINYVFKLNFFSTFRRLPVTEKTHFFALLQKSSDGFLDDYAIRSQMQASGIRYSPQFMRNLFYYAHKKYIRDDNKDLSAFLSLPGLFICKNNGEIRLQKGICTLACIVFLTSIFMLVYVTLLFPQTLVDLRLYLAKQQYFILVLEVLLIIVDVIGLVMSLGASYVCVFRFIPALRFTKHYQTAWKRRDLFEIGEQNLHCGNKVNE